MKEKIKDSLLIIIGFIGLYLFINHINGFEYPVWFYSDNPGIKKYVGTNVVSAWADFSFFTYHSLILFSLWLVFLGISNLFNLEKLNKVLKKDSIITFITLNYLLTCVMYTVFELFSAERTFGLYAKTSFAYHNLGTNLIVHYLFTIIAIITYIKIKPSDRISNVKKYVQVLVYPLCYLFSYYIVVNITGKMCYDIEWYPYPIFDVESFLGMFGLNIKSNTFGCLLLILTIIAIVVLYCLCFVLLSKLKQKMSIKK